MLYSDTQIFVETLLRGTLFPGYGQFFGKSFEASLAHTGISNGSQPGEVLSPIPGEMRLQSDFELARGMYIYLPYYGAR